MRKVLLFAALLAAVLLFGCVQQPPSCPTGQVAKQIIAFNPNNPSQSSYVCVPVSNGCGGLSQHETQDCCFSWASQNNVATPTCTGEWDWTEAGCLYWCHV